jgi:threonine dehydrogenase-like Zn-dependent dehydrogenase
MRALVYTGPGRVNLEEQPRHAPSDDEVEIAVEFAGICGSDVSGFLGHSPRRKAPLVLGHELVGRLNDGTRVIANPLISCGHCASCLSGQENLCATWKLLGMDRTQGAFAEYVSIPRQQVYQIPDELSSVRAVLAEPLANIVHLFRIAAPPPVFRLAIIGAGTMGALALQCSFKFGAREILMADINDQRLSTMTDMGASFIANVASTEGMARAKEIAGWGFDLTIDASGGEAARQLAFDLCRPGGQVVLLGMAVANSKLDFATSIRKEHRVQMTFAYTPVDFQQALTMLIDGVIDLSSNTVTYPLESGQDAFDLVTTHPGAALKFLLQIKLFQSRRHGFKR